MLLMMTHIVAKPRMISNKEADVIVRSQEVLKDRILRMYSNMRKKEAANFTLGAIESRIVLVDSYWRKFLDNDDILITKSEICNYYVGLDIHEQIEQIYLQVRAMLVDARRALEATAQKGDESATQQPASKTALLPKIQLPEFSGLFEDWPSFREAFTSLIIEDQTLTAVKKMHYLKTSVKGEALQLIHCYTITADNFERAWITLNQRYQNRRLLVRAFCGAFLALPRMKEESVEDLRRIYHGVLTAIGSLENVGRPMFNSPDLFVHLVINILDTRTRREWESAIGGTEPPSFEELRRFLEGRLQMLTALRSSQNDSAPAKSSDA